MKNVIISFGIFVLMIVTILFSLNYLNKVCTKLGKSADNLEISINKEDWENAQKQSTNFLDTWKKYADNIAIFVHHEEIDNVNTEIYKLTQYIKFENKEEALADIHVIKFYIKHINNFEKINAQNIF